MRGTRRRARRLSAVFTGTVMILGLGLPAAMARPCADCMDPDLPDNPGAPDCGITATTEPSISGTAKVGVQLTGSRGVWAGSPTGFGYSWHASGTQIPGATSLTFTPTADQVGKTLQLRVVATKVNCASGVDSSAPTAAVALGSPLLLSSAPLLGHGGGKVGVEMNVVGGAWNPSATTQTYQWLRNGAPITGATAASYTPVAGDVGATVAVRVNGKRAGYADGTTTLSGVTIQAADSEPEVPDPDPDPDPVALATTGRPTVTGTARFGALLRVTTGSWAGSPTSFGYQWLRSGTPIRGATGAEYRAVRADIGTVLTVRVSAHRSGATSVGVTVSAGRVSKARMAWAGKRAVKVRGVARAGHKVRSSLGKAALRRGADPDAATVRYQWLRDGKKIRGAKKRGYRLRAADVGSRIRLKVVLRKPGHTKVVLRTATVRIR